jgi:hypothetical protein
MFIDYISESGKMMKNHDDLIYLTNIFLVNIATLRVNILENDQAIQDTISKCDDSCVCLRMEGY